MVVEAYDVLRDRDLYNGRTTQEEYGGIVNTANRQAVEAEL